MASSRTRPAGRPTAKRASSAPRKAAPGQPTTDTGYVEVPTGDPIPVTRTWEVNGDQAQPLGPWETPGPPLDAAGDLPPQEQRRLAARAQQLLEQTPPEEPALMDPDAMFGSPEPDPDAGAGSGSAAPTTAGASTGSSPLAGANPLQARARAKAFGQLAAAAFAMFSGLLNARLRLDEDDSTWLADEEDLAAFGTPAGRLVARHAPLPEGTDAGDLADGIGVAIAATGYVIKNLQVRAAAVRARRRAAAPAEA